MNMRCMKLEAQPSVPSFYFMLFILNKQKIVMSVCFLNYQCNKNTLKIKVLQMPCKFSMTFSGIFENIWHWEHSRGRKHVGTRVQGAPPASWGHGGSPPLIPATTHSFFLPQTPLTSSNPSPSSFCCHFRSPCSKHLSQNCLGRLFLGMWLLHWSN